MDSTVQNGAMAAAYAVLFFVLLRSTIANYTKMMIYATAFACIYNVFYDAAVQFRLVTSIALAVRVLGPLEACWRVADKNRWFHGALVLAAVCLGWPAVPSARAWGYLSVRSVETCAVTAICLMTFIAYLGEPLYGEAKVLFRHLGLQTAWMGLHSVVSVTCKWSLKSWGNYSACRWAYVLCSIGIVLSYRSLIKPRVFDPLAPGSRIE